MIWVIEEMKKDVQPIKKVLKGLLYHWPLPDYLFNHLSPTSFPPAWLLVRIQHREAEHDEILQVTFSSPLPISYPLQTYMFPISFHGNKRILYMYYTNKQLKSTTNYHDWLIALSLRLLVMSASESSSCTDGRGQVDREVPFVFQYRFDHTHDLSGWPKYHRRAKSIT